VVIAEDPYGRYLGFIDRNRYVFLQLAPQLYSRGLVDPAQDHYFSENMVAPEIEALPLDL
jgi:hypothetical protein